MLGRKILRKSFKPNKCTMALKMAISRIKILRNQKEAKIKSTKRELARLLEAGQDQTAMIRVQHVSRDEKIKSAYDLVEIYCKQVSTNFFLIEDEKSCPISLKEAIASLVYACPRCPDIEELRIFQEQIKRKYGKEFISEVLELRPGVCVGLLLIEKLSAKDLDGTSKIKIQRTIAEQHNIKWKPNQDVLPRETTFEKANNFVQPNNNQNSGPGRGEQEYVERKVNNFVQPNISQSSGPGRGDQKSVEQIWQTEYKDSVAAGARMEEREAEEYHKKQKLEEQKRKEQIFNRRESGSSRPSHVHHKLPEFDEVFQQMDALRRARAQEQ